MSLDINDNRYLRAKDARDYICLSEGIFYKFVKKYNIKTIRGKEPFTTLYDRYVLDTYIRKREKFYEKNIGTTEIRSLFKLSNQITSIVSKNGLKAVETPLYCKIKSRGRDYYYDRNEIMELYENIKVDVDKRKSQYIDKKNLIYHDIDTNVSIKKLADIDTNRYISAIDAPDYMGLSLYVFYDFVREYNPKKVNVKKSNRIFYDKNTLDKYIKKRKEFYEKCICTDELRSLFEKGIISRRLLFESGIRAISPPTYCKIKKTHYYDKEEIMNLCEKNKIDIDDYYYTNEVVDLLSLSLDRVLMIIKEFNLEYRYITRRSKGLLKEEVHRLYDLQNEFWDKHCTLEYAKERLPEACLEDLEKISIPSYALKSELKLNINNYVFEKKKIDELDYTYSQEEKDDYISRREGEKILGVGKTSFFKIVEEYGVYVENSGFFKRYSRKDIEFLKEQQSHIGERYLSSEMAKERYGISDWDLRVIDSRIKIPTFCRHIVSKCREMYIYDSVDIEKYIEKRELIDKINNTFGNTDFDTFIKRLNFYENKLKALLESNYTYKRWLKYIDNKFTRDKSKNIRTVNDKISRYISSTQALNALLVNNEVNEVYELNHNQINLWLNSVTNKRARCEIVAFFKCVDADVKLKANGSNKINNTFNINKIKKGDDKSFKKNNTESNKDNSIYDYEVYLKIFKHLSNIPLHVERATQEMKNLKCTYASTWLYLLLHLNNAWRHSDVTDFPRLYFKDILDEWEINDIDWFSENNISEAKSRRIISRIIQYDYRISKTEVYGHFFSSDKLAPAIATAILMLEVYWNNISDIMPPEYDKPIMYFENSQYNEPTPSIIKNCFYKCKIKGFKFASKKMNKTVLTYIYNIASKIAPSGFNILLLPQHMRKHIEGMSTIQYIEFTDEQLEFLSGEIFERGEFGFIADSLINLISDNHRKSIERTEEIKNIKTIFGGVDKIESLARMLNSFNDEKKEIIKLIEDKSFEECQELTYNMFTGNLPSKSIDIQCLFSQSGCKFAKKDCENCKYQIPNIYVLRTLCISLKEEMLLYLRTRQLCKRIKLSGRIHSKINMFMDAIDKFGMEYVYNCIDMKRDEFLDLFNKIPEVNELLMIK
ncbi:hypothetical protein [Clostridium perfringens]|uniref:hypothetical protein n=1 Tax=Clostridium perfringens TaxID=1502 RepID=UPI001ABB5F9A|nr:hypothetical protein [Clostridium perfringens]MBO3374108.1 hypothetical protein [Clostridium perfringens]